MAPASELTSSIPRTDSSHAGSDGSGVAFGPPTAGGSVEPGVGAGVALTGHYRRRARADRRDGRGKRRHRARRLGEAGGDPLAVAEPAGAMVGMGVAVGATVGVAVGAAVGVGVGIGVGIGVGVGVGEGVDFGVPVGVGLGDGLGVATGDGVGAGMTTEPTVQRPPGATVNATKLPLNWQLPTVIGGPNPFFVRFPTTSTYAATPSDRRTRARADWSSSPGSGRRGRRPESRCSSCPG